MPNEYIIKICQIVQEDATMYGKLFLINDYMSHIYDTI